MKTQRLSYHRLVDALVERGLIDRETLDHVLQQCQATGALLPEVIVNDGLVSDWEVSRVSCEVFGLPFLSLDFYPAAVGLIDGLDADFMRQYALVPLDRFGEVLTIAMPGMVPSEVLDTLAQSLGKIRILPVVGTVQSNRQWFRQHAPAPEIARDHSIPAGELSGIDDHIDAALPAPAVDLDEPSTVEQLDGAWEEMFDMGEQAVRLNLEPDEEAD